MRGVAMNKEFWLDGFNFFHHWDVTKGLLRPDSGFDIVKAVERSLRMLGRRLGSRCGMTVVYLDGGLDRREARLGMLRVRYAGPGRKADDRLADDLDDLRDNARLVTAVSNDRELKARLRAGGAACLGVGEYLSLLEGDKGKGGAKGGGKHARANAGAKGGASVDAEIMREKCRILSPSEVNAWLDFFGGDEEG